MHWLAEARCRLRGLSGQGGNLLDRRDAWALQPAIPASECLGALRCVFAACKCCPCAPRAAPDVTFGGTHASVRRSVAGLKHWLHAVLTGDGIQVVPVQCEVARSVGRPCRVSQTEQRQPSGRRRQTSGQGSSAPGQGDNHILWLLADVADTQAGVARLQPDLTCLQPDLACLQADVAKITARPRPTTHL